MPRRYLKLTDILHISSFRDLTTLASIDLCSIARPVGGYIYSFRFVYFS